MLTNRKKYVYLIAEVYVVKTRAILKILAVSMMALFALAATAGALRIDG